MGKLAILRLLEGNLGQGVNVVLTIDRPDPTNAQGNEADLGRSRTEVSGQLPPNANLVQTIEQLQSNYRGLRATRIQPKKVTYDSSINQRIAVCQSLDRKLRSHLNTWLSSDTFRPIRDRWLVELMKGKVRILVRSSSPSLLKVPWHLWDLVERNPLAEVALSWVDGETVAKPKIPTLRDKVRILAILGDRTNIDVEKDRELLNNLTDAEVQFLDEPQRREINDQLWDQTWDILFFAGHSRTEDVQGKIYINQTESLTINELRYALQKSVNKGLQLAIFNSCDGMGLALELQQLQLPQVIVMREPVPDYIAQEFLRYFLPEFAKGQTLYLAERDARLRLHGQEDEFPCASWLPVIFQSPAAVPPTWNDLGRRPTDLSPYRGLFPFREEDAGFFYGRESFTQTMVEAINTSMLARETTTKESERYAFVGIIGASGSGKSSVVFGGLVPELRKRGNWQIIGFRPGHSPFAAIAKAWVTLRTPDLSEPERLSLVLDFEKTWQDVETKATLPMTLKTATWDSPGTKLLVVVDQFEELYTECQDLEERQAFIDALLESAQLTNVAVALTLWADFLPQALNYPPLAKVLPRGMHTLSAMNEKDLQAVIEWPADHLGVTLEAGLTKRMVNAVLPSDGNLPLLEFALQALWNKRQGIKLTHAAYEEIGGLEVAVANHAEEVYNRLSESEQERSRLIFLQLVRPGEGTEDIRRVATRAEVGDSNWDLVVRLASEPNRLVVTGKDAIAKTETVELIHEALIRQWSRLRSWIDENRDFLLWRQRLQTAMQQWEKSDRDQGALLHGKLLLEAENWLQQRSEGLEAERKYISASQRRRRQNTLRMGGALAGVFVLAATASVAWWRNYTVQNNAHLRELASFADELFKVYEEKKDTLKYEQKYPSDYKDPNRKTIDEQKRDLSNQYQEILINALEMGQELRRSSNVDKNTKIQVLMALNRAIYDGNYGFDIDLTECRPHRGESFPLRISEDTRIAICSSYDGTVKVLDGKTGNKLKVMKGQATWISGVRFSPDNKIIAFGTEKGEVKLWDRTTKKVTQTLNDGLSQINTFEYSPDGRFIIVGKLNGNSLLWNTATGQKIRTLDGGEVNIENIQFSPDGKMVAITGSNKNRDGVTHKLWNIQSGRELKTFNSEGSYFRHIKPYFSNDSKTITYPVNDYGTKTIWDIQTNRPIRTFEDPGGRNNYSPDKRVIATTVDASNDNTVTLQEASTGETIKTLSAEAGKTAPDPFLPNSVEAVSKVSNTSFSPDGKLLAVASKDRTMSLWDWKTGEKLKTLNGLLDNTGSISISPNGKFIVASTSITNEKDVIKLWDITTGREIKILTQEVALRSFGMGIIHELFFSPDSKIIALSTSEKSVRLWSTTTGQELNILGLTNFPKQLDRPRFFLEKGKVLAAKVLDGRTLRWNAATHKSMDSIYSSKILVSDVVFINNDKWISVIDWDGNINTKEISTGKTIRSSHLNFPVASNVKFSEDGGRVAAATRDGVKIWNISRGKEVRKLPSNNDKDNDWIKDNLWFSPDGKILVTKKKAIELWDVKTGKQIENFKTQLSSATDVAFSPDNKQIAIGNSDGIAHLFDLTTGKVTNTLKQHSTAIDTITFSSDGNILLSISGAEIKIWDVTTGQVIGTYKVPGDTRNISYDINRDEILLYRGDGGLNNIKMTRLNLNLSDLIARGCNQVRDRRKAQDLCK